MMHYLEFFRRYPGWHRLSRNTVEYEQACQLVDWGMLYKLGRFPVFKLNPAYQIAV